MIHEQALRVALSLLDDHPDLPRPTNIQTRVDLGEFSQQVRFDFSQFTSTDASDALAAWACEFGVPVTVDSRDGTLYTSAEFRVGAAVVGLLSFQPLAVEAVSA